MFQHRKDVSIEKPKINPIIADNDDPFHVVEQSEKNNTNNGKRTASSLDRFAAP